MNEGRPEVYSGNGLPNITPTVPVALWVDEDTGIVYAWFNNQWHT